MEITKSMSNMQTILKISGSLNTLNSLEFENMIQDLTENECSDVLVDASELEYISSSGLRVFLKLNKKAFNCGGHVIIEGLSDEIKEIFEITGLSATFEIL